MRIALVVLIWGSLVSSAWSRDVAGVPVPEQVQLDKATLTLNGAGLRSVFFIKIYVAALYLESTQKRAEGVMSAGGAKRIALQVVADEVGSERFLEGLRKGISKNQDEAQLATLKDRMLSLEQMLGALGTVKRGDRILFDWQGGETHLRFNDRELGRLPGEDFYRALLTIWVGEHPVTEELKTALLGGE